MPGISAVSPPISAQPAWRQPSAIEATTAAATSLSSFPVAIIVEEEQRLGALDDEIVDAHRDQVDADPVMLAQFDRQLELGSDPVIGRDQQRIVIARRLQVEKAAESAQLGIGAGRARSIWPAARWLLPARCRRQSKRRHRHRSAAFAVIGHEPPPSHIALGIPRHCRQKRADAVAPACRSPVRRLACPRRDWAGRLVAQMESGERGILPIDSSGTLEITGIKVDVGGKDAEYARAIAGWRIAQREGFKALWAKTQQAARSAEAPNLTDSALDGLVSSIVVEQRADRPQPLHRRPRRPVRPGPGRRTAGSCRAGRRSAPMLLIPVMISRRHRDQRRTAQPVAARLGAVSNLSKPDRLCPGQRARGRSAAGQRRPDQAARPGLVAQHPRSLRRRQHPGRRSAGRPALSGRAGQGAVHRSLRARRQASRQLRAERPRQQRPAAR